MSRLAVAIRSFLLAFACVASGGLRAEVANELRVFELRSPKVVQPSDLYRRLHELAQEAIDDRSTAYEKLKTPADVAEWQRTRRAIFLRALGGLPERTAPLNARTVGQLDGRNFRVEKVLFDSRPQHRITATLYLPTTAPPYPGVIVPCGHSATGKGADAYQRVSMLLAQNGMAALCYDPIGQGERYQTFGPDGRPLGVHYHGSPNSVRQLREIPGEPHFNSVEEHTLIGIGAILTGTNSAQYRIHDGMRAIDYLVSRQDIDPRRIGCTGNSGGGTLTAYLMALDDRIACAAPACYLTTFRRLLATSGPQDAEQNLFGQLRDGLDEADYVLLRAPQPTLLCAGTRDATFDIVGTWDIFRQSKRVFARFGLPERVEMVEADEPHGFTQPLRVGAVQWLRRWLLKIDDAVTEPELPVFTQAELLCTPDGQVMKLPGERSVFSLNEQRAESFAAQRRALWRDGPRDAALQRVRELADIRRAKDLPPAKVESAGVVAHPRYRVEKLRIELDTQLVLPALAFQPLQRSSDARRVLYLASDGKLSAAAPDGPIEELVLSGAVVVAVDLSGLGETAVKHPRDWGGTLFPANTQEFFLAYLLGRSLVGLRAEEVMQVARVAARYGEKSIAAPPPVHWIAVGSAAGIPALHAAALEPSLVSTLTLRDTLDAWLPVVANPTAGEQLAHIVHGALTAYDLPDLRASLPAGCLVQGTGAKK